jgi:hypothetical protein
MDDDLPPARLMEVTIERCFMPDYWIWKIWVENYDLFRGCAKIRSDARLAAYGKMFTLLRMGWHEAKAPPSY